MCGLTDGGVLTEIKIIPEYINASSQLSDADNKTHSPYNLIDGDLSTAYVEGVDGVGVGEYIQFGFPGYMTYSQNMYITKIVWDPGYQASDTLLEKSGHPTSIHIFEGLTNAFEYYSDIHVSTPIEMGTTIIYKFPEPILIHELMYLFVRINSAEAGSVYEDTCISEIEFYGYQLVD